MRLPYHRYWVLPRISRGLRRSDPHLAAMLAIFARLTAGEAITSWDQSGPPRGRMRHVMVRLGSAIAIAAACLCACAHWVLRGAAISCAAVRRRCSGETWTAGPRAGKVQ
jgi:hypothetical protein